MQTRAVTMPNTMLNVVLWTDMMTFPMSYTARQAILYAIIFKLPMGTWSVINCSAVEYVVRNINMALPVTNASLKAVFEKQVLGLANVS